MIVPIQGGVVLIDETTGNTVTLKSEGSGVYSLDTNIRDGIIKIRDGSNPSNTLNINSDGSIISRVSDKDGNGITSKDEGSSVRSIDVNVRSGVISTVPSGNSIRYDKMTNDLAISNGSWTPVYSYSGSGILFFAEMAFNESNIDIRVTLDGVVIANTFNLGDLGSNYKLALSGTVPMLPPWMYVWNSNTNIAVQFGNNGSLFNSSFLIEAKAYLNGKKVNRGLVVRAL